MIFVFLLLSCAIKYILTQNDAFLLLELDSNFLQVYHLKARSWCHFSWNSSRNASKLELVLEAWVTSCWKQPDIYFSRHAFNAISLFSTHRCRIFITRVTILWHPRTRWSKTLLFTRKEYNLIEPGQKLDLCHIWEIQWITLCYNK